MTGSDDSKARTPFNCLTSVSVIRPALVPALGFLVTLAFTAWFILVLWKSYTPFWELVQNTNRLTAFAERFVNWDIGRIYYVSAIVYLLVAGFLCVGQRSSIVRKAVRFPLGYPLSLALLVGAFFVASVPRRGELTLELLSFLVIIGGAYAVGRTVWDRLWSESAQGLEAFILSSTFGLGILAIATAIVTHVGILSRESVYVLLLLLFAVSFRTVARDLLQAVRVLFSTSLSTLLDQSLVWKLTFPLIMGQAFFLFLCALLPEFGSDALAGHLLYPRWFLEANGWVDLYFADFHFGLPTGYNLLFVLPLVLSDEVGAKLLQYWAGILVVMGAFALGRRYINSTVGVLAASMLINVPVFAWEMQTAYVDLIFALFGSAVIYTAARWHENYDKRWLYLGGIFAGFALNGKLQALFLIPAIVCATVVGLRLRGRSTNRPGIPKDILIAPTVAIVVGSSWYLHNLLTTGNPLLPFFNAIFQSPYYPPINEVFDRDHFGVGDGLVNKYILLPWNLVMFPERFQGNLGPAMLLLAPAILAWKRRPRPMLAVLLLSSIYGLAMILTVPVSRYLLVLLPAVSVLISSGVSDLIDRLRGVPKATVIAGATISLLVVYSLNLPIFFDVRHRNWVASSFQQRDLSLDAIGNESDRESYVAQRLTTYRAMRWAAEHLPKSAKIITYQEDRNYYIGSRALSANQITFKGDIFSNETEKLLEALKKLGVTHVLVNGNAAPGRTEPIFRLDSDFANRHLQVLFEVDGSYVFSLSYDSARYDREHPRIVKDLIFEVETFRIAADIAKENRVRVSNLNQGNDSRRGILQIAPASFEYALEIPESVDIKLAFGLGAMSYDHGDGVLGRIEVIHDNRSDEVFRRFIDTNGRKATDRRWFDEQVDLTRYRGKDIVLRFIADTGENERSNSTGDWIVWSRPKISSAQ